MDIQFIICFVIQWTWGFIQNFSGLCMAILWRQKDWHRYKNAIVDITRPNMEARRNGATENEVMPSTARPNNFKKLILELPAARGSRSKSNSFLLYPIQLNNPFV